MPKCDKCGAVYFDDGDCECKLCLACTEREYVAFEGGKGAKWVTSSLDVKLSPFGRRVADLLDDLYAGIYHLPLSALRKVEWCHPEYMTIAVRGGFATYDDSQLTRLVFLCHDYGVRGQLVGCGPHYIRLMLSRRRLRKGGSTWDRHPMLESAVDSYRLTHP